MTMNAVILIIIVLIIHIGIYLRNVLIIVEAFVMTIVERIQIKTLVNRYTIVIGRDGVQGPLHHVGFIQMKLYVELVDVLGQVSSMTMFLGMSS